MVKRSERLFPANFNRTFRKQIYNSEVIFMKRTILLVSICMLAFVCNAFSQDSMNKDEGKIEKDTMLKKFVTAEDAQKSALNVGAKMPAFSLPDEKGEMVSSDELLKTGNLVVVFYRGAWCPYCNLYLRSLQKSLPEIEKNGGKLVAISVENPDTSLTVSQKNELSFKVLSDGNLDLARKFGIVYQLSNDTNEKYKGYGVDLVKQNGTVTPDLPLSATYIIKQNGEISYAFLEPDYQKRAEPNVIIENLAKLNKKPDAMMAKPKDKMKKN
jgi:peroxiredoxin